MRNGTCSTTEAEPLSHSNTLAPDQRAPFLRYYRGPFDPRFHLPAHVLLLLDDRRPWEDIDSALYCSNRTIAR
jgi:hypothetical protein